MSCDKCTKQTQKNEDLDMAYDLVKTILQSNPFDDKIIEHRTDIIKLCVGMVKDLRKEIN